MRIAEVSTFVNYSVGKIMQDICHYINGSTKDKCKVFYGRDKSIINENVLCFGSTSRVFLNAFFARAFDNDGFCSSCMTNKLIKGLKEFKPDIIHLHCLHGYVFNIKKLFKFIKEHDIKVVWTMHDTWAFTGHCCYFGLAECNKRKHLCYKCPQKKSYPKSFFSNSKKNFINKRNIIKKIDKENLTFVSPSAWMDSLIGESYLKDYNHLVIHNGINTELFNTSLKSKKCETGKILLGVASVWDERKGLEFFIKLSNLIANDWRIILVGKLPKNTKISERIEHIERTKDQSLLRELYYSSSIFFNPTLDENYPTVNLEAQLCGCKVLTFDSGGSKETNCGNLYITGQNVDEILNNIYSIYQKPLHDIDIQYASCLNMTKKYYELFLALKEN